MSGLSATPDPVSDHKPIISVSSTCRLRVDLPAEEKPGQSYHHAALLPLLRPASGTTGRMPITQQLENRLEDGFTPLIDDRYAERDHAPILVPIFPADHLEFRVYRIPEPNRIHEPEVINTIERNDHTRQNRHERRTHDENQEPVGDTFPKRTLCRPFPIRMQRIPVAAQGTEHDDVAFRDRAPTRNESLALMDGVSVFLEQVHACIFSESTAKSYQSSIVSTV